VEDLSDCFLAEDNFGHEAFNGLDEIATDTVELAQDDGSGVSVSGGGAEEAVFAEFVFQILQLLTVSVADGGGERGDLVLVSGTR
jgi:hypothetical protein